MIIKYPKNQRPVVTYNNQYLVTKDKIGTYILYSVNEMGICTKIKTSVSPLFPEVYPNERGGER